MDVMIARGSAGLILEKIFGQALVTPQRHAMHYRGQQISYG